MRIAVVGPGAMGCLFAALLARVKGNEVFLIDHKPKRARYLTNRGLTLTGLTKGRVKGVGLCDVVLFLVKALHTLEAARRARRCVGKDAVVVTLQNGLGNLEVLRSVLARSGTVLAGTTTHGATLLGRGRVRHAGKGETRIGWDSPVQARAARFAAAVLSRAGIRARPVKGTARLLWSKLVLSSALNALGTVLGVRNGGLVEDESARYLLCACAEESAAVARAAGIGIAPGAAARKAVAVCRATAANVNSMLQDFRKGRPTEVDHINGAVARTAASRGREAPINRAFWRCLTRSFS